MAGARQWFDTIRRTLIRSNCKSVAVLDHTNSVIHNESLEEESSHAEEETKRRNKKEITIEHLAAVKIQAHFRGHLARRAFRALRSLVRLQAVVRGVCVRRQVRIASHCMQAMVRLQVRVRARQLLRGSQELEPSQQLLRYQNKTSVHQHNSGTNDLSN